MKAAAHYLYILFCCVFAALVLAMIEVAIGFGIVHLIEHWTHGLIAIAVTSLLVIAVWAANMEPETTVRIFAGWTVIPCIVERGGFSTEVTFSIDTGELNRHVGFSHQDHVLNDEKKPFEPDGLPPGAIVNGYVKCRRLRTEGQMALVEVPSGETIYVRCDELKEA